jgi:hypothetical protein
VDQPVVVVAQQDEVVQVRGTAVGPVDEVMRVEPPLPLAPREPTRGLVAVAEDAEDRLWNLSAPAADPLRAPSGLQDPFDPGIEASHGPFAGHKAQIVEVAGNRTRSGRCRDCTDTESR